MELMLNPNLGYILLMLGILLALLAIISPGTGLLEAGALGAFFLVGVQMFSVPINLWAIPFLLIGGVIFVLAVLRKGHKMLLPVSLLILFVGAAYIYRGAGWRMAVNPWLVLVVSLVEGGYIWISVRGSLEAIRTPPAQSMEALLGAFGEAKSDIYHDGSVQVSGELWSAWSRQPVPVNSRVRVVGREGFLLEVEAAPEE